MDYTDERRHLPLINKNKLLVCGHVFKDDTIHHTVRKPDVIYIKRNCLKCSSVYHAENKWLRLCPTCRLSKEVIDNVD